MIRVPNRLIRYAIIFNYSLRDAVHQLIKKLEDIEENQPDDKESQTKQGRGAAGKGRAQAKRG